MSNQKCRSCDAVKMLSEFSRDASMSTGYKSVCKDCRNTSRRNAYAAMSPEQVDELLSKNRSWYAQNAEVAKTRQAEYRAANRSRIYERQREYRQESAHLLRERSKAWREQNKSLVLALNAKRKAARISAYAGWDRELTDFVATEAADLCAKRERVTGLRWHVDHSIPLRGRSVCGLHVWNNLSVVPAVFNLSKGNKVGGRWLSRSWL